MHVHLHGRVNGVERGAGGPVRVRSRCVPCEQLAVWSGVRIHGQPVDDPAVQLGSDRLSK
jgi:hypothetical protein